jgi:hypothetical protein
MANTKQCSTNIVRVILLGVGMIVPLVFSAVTPQNASSVSLSSSPPFPRQDLVSESGYFYRWNYNAQIQNSNETYGEEIDRDCLVRLKGFDLVDVESVTYASNGRTLDVTFWLNAPFEVNPPKGSYPLYGMYLLSNPEQGIEAHGEHYYWIYFNGTHWNEILKDTPIYTNQFTGIDRTIFSRTMNITTNPPTIGAINSTSDYYFKENERYVHLSLDLSLVNYPQSYALQFFKFDLVHPSVIEPGIVAASQRLPQVEVGGLVSKENEDCVSNPVDPILAFTDFFHLIGIPKPEFGISASQSSIQLRPGEEKEISLHLNSTSVTPVFAQFFIKQDERNPNLSSIEFSPPEVRVEPNGVSSIQLSVEADQNATIKSFELPVYANITIPRFSTTLEYSPDNPQDIREERFFVNVIMQEPPTTEELFATFWGAYGGLISFVGGGFAAGVSVVIGNRFSKPTK